MFNPQPPGEYKINLRDFSLPPVRIAKPNKANDIAHAGKDAGKGEHLFIASGSANCGNQRGDTSEAQIRATSRSNCATLRHIPKEVYILLQRYSHAHVNCCSSHDNGNSLDGHHLRSG